MQVLHALCTALLKALLCCRKVVQMCEYAGYAAAGYAAGYAASIMCSVQQLVPPPPLSGGMFWHPS